MTLLSRSPRSRLHEIYVKPKNVSNLPKNGGYVRVRVDLYSAHPLTEVILCPCGAAGSIGAGKAHVGFLIVGSGGAICRSGERGARGKWCWE